MDVLIPTVVTVFFMAACFAGLVLLMIALVGIARYYRDKQEKHYRAWEMLAKRNNLTIVAYGFMPGIEVAGSYKGYRLRLEKATKSPGIERESCTRLVLSKGPADSDQISLLQPEQAGNEPPPVDEVLVNWFARLRPFDFDEVKLIQATDEEVERFAVQIGNDTELVRKAQYGTMRCSVSPACRLSPNTMRILERTFGEVAVRNPG